MKNKKTLIIMLAAIAAVVAILFVIVIKTYKKSGNTIENESNDSSSVISESTRSYTSEELSAITEWWNTVSIVAVEENINEKTSIASEK